MIHPRHIATIPKSPTERVHVTLTEFAGRALVDVRTYAAFNGVGPLRPTRKGVSLARERLPDLIKALQQAEREASR